MAYGKIDLFKYMFGTPKDAGVHLSLLCSIPITSTLIGYMAMGFYIEGQDALEEITELAYNDS